MSEKNEEKKLADVEETEESKEKKEIKKDVKKTKAESKEADKKTDAPEKEEKTDGKKTDTKAAGKDVVSEKAVEETKSKEAEVPEEVKADGEQEQTEAEEEKPEEKKESVLPSDLNFLPGVRKDLPKLRAGDIVRVSYKVIEGGKERIQAFEGTVIAVKNTGVAKTITIRKTSFGIAVERIFPLNSKMVQKIVVKKHSKIRRAKLYYLRKLKGKAARLKELR